MSLIAYHNNPKVKATYLKRVRAHAKADEIVKGQYWKDGKGCAVGCTIHSKNHIAYETELGIPEWLARVEDTLFEGMPNARAKKWPAQFLAAIKPGVDLEKAKNPFLIFVLKSTLKSMKKVKFNKTKFPDVQKAIEGSEAAVKEMIHCLTEGLDTSAAARSAWSAESAARSAWSAESVARSAARSAWSAESVARSAAWSAESVARSAESAESVARSAARSAWSAKSVASSARSAAWSARSAESASFDQYGNELLKILKGIK